MRHGLLLLAACGSAPPVPAHAPSTTVTVHTESDASPEPSPFQAAAEAFKEQQAADDKQTEALIQDVMHPAVGVALATVQRSAQPVTAFGLKLDATEADVGKEFIFGRKACDGMVDRFCPARNFVVELAPRASAPVPYTLRGRFAGGKLYEIDATVTLPAREYTLAEQRVMARAFDAEVKKALGAPTSAAYSRFEYGPALVIQYSQGRDSTVVLTGSLDLRNKLVEEDGKLSEAEQQAFDAKEHARLCTCRHFALGDTFPRDEDFRQRSGGAPAELHYRVLSASPATCTAKVAVRYRYGGEIGVMEKSCTKIPAAPVPQSCPMCGIR